MIDVPRRRNEAQRGSSVAPPRHSHLMHTPMQIGEPAVQANLSSGAREFVPLHQPGPSTPQDQAENGQNSGSRQNGRRRRGGRSHHSQARADVDPSTAARQAQSTAGAPRRSTRIVPSGASQALDLKAALIEELRRESYECLVCIDSVKIAQPVWSCKTCWAVFHLPCIQKWARSGTKHPSGPADSLPPWRCPGCQTRQTEIPESCLCFCGKTRDPKPSTLSTPHACSNACGRLRQGGCPHVDTAHCHPGPCEKCTLRAPFKSCFCGKQKLALKCSEIDYSQGGVSCHQICGRPLACGVHQCSKICHQGECGACSVKDVVQCFCGRAIKEILCRDHDQGLTSTGLTPDGDSKKWQGHFVCESRCLKTFACGKHQCQKECHPLASEVTTCPRDPGQVKTCPCGKTELSIVRHSCSDPVPTCGQTCSKTHPSCGHQCQRPCHDGPCPPCQVELEISCRCGQSQSIWKCDELRRHEGPVECQRKCSVIRNCGKHQCGRRCCPLAHLAGAQTGSTRKKGRQQVQEEDDPDHLHECLLQCGRLLGCKNHRCPVLDHRGACPPCLEASFEEVSCHCGKTVLQPPVPCGVVPQCHHPCARPASCGHPGVLHDCHADDIPCPPCPFLVAKPCNCGKTMIKNVPCHRGMSSCGQACGKTLDCGAHRCTKTCHLDGQCEKPCEQACGKPRKGCGHPHLEPCHAPLPCDCHSEACKATVMVSCPCGHLTKPEICGGRDDNVVLLTLDNRAVDRNLKCNAHCELEQRNKRLALAFGIDPATKASASTPAAVAANLSAAVYDPSILSYAQNDIIKARAIEGMFKDFVSSGKKSTCLPPMNGHHRKYVHDLANYFSLGAEAVDSEPNRSVLLHRRIDSMVPAVLPSDLVSGNKNGNKRSDKEVKPLVANLRDLKGQDDRGQAERANAIYIEGIFGLDEENLCRLIEPSLKGLEYDLSWQSSEDCVLIVRQRSFDPQEHQTRDSRIRATRSELRLLAERSGAFVFAEGAYWDPSKQQVIWRESTRSSLSKPVVAAEATASLVPTQNAFQVLDQDKDNTPRPAWDSQ